MSDFVQSTSVGLTQNTNRALSIDRLYLTGYGQGSSFAAFVAFCFPSSVSGFVQAGGHGYKTKGDGVFLDDGAGECPNCQYYPIKVLPALSIGRSFRHCAFTSTGDTISPSSLHVAMCNGLRNNGHTSTLYIQGSAIKHVRPTQFLARAALCLQIGGATAPTPLPEASCGALTDTSVTPSFISSDNYGASLSSSKLPNSFTAVTAEKCPAWDWHPTLSSHQCPCNCNGK